MNRHRSTDGTNNRLLIYCVSQPVPEGVLLHNTLSREMVLLTQGEWEHRHELQALHERMFLVPDDFDDIKLAKQVRQLYKLMSPRPKAIRSFTIFTTTDCNANCFYCYESGRSRVPMSLDTAHKVSAFIYNNYQKLLETDPKARVCLAWFGGEPLYNRQVIDAICNDLQERQVNYYSRMVSNGYLFDEATVKCALEHWNLKLVQITLDGTEKVYNRVKDFIYRDNAFQRVTGNIHTLLQAGIKVNVRMNIDVHNAANLLELADYLHDHFQGMQGLSCYSHPLFEVSGENAVKRTEERREEVYALQVRLQQKLERMNLSRAPILDRKIKVNQCMADSGSSITILPGGGDRSLRTLFRFRLYLAH